MLISERSDRREDGTRRSVLGALTLFGLHELAARHGSRVELAELIHLRFAGPEKTLHELFGRLVVNVLVGNTDDHPRNHAAFWDVAGCVRAATVFQLSERNAREVADECAAIVREQYDDVCAAAVGAGEATRAML